MYHDGASAVQHRSRSEHPETAIGALT